MKPIAFFLSVMAVASVAFYGCDEVEAPYTETNNNPDTGQVTLQTQKVLVEDYTGHKCGNCPKATRSVYNLKPTYGEKLIILAVHAGFFAGTGTPPFTYNFTCPEGVQLDTDFGISAAGNPNGMVNRKQVSGSYIIDYGDWGAQVASILNASPFSPVTIEIATAYDNVTRNLDATINTKFTSSLPNTYALTVYLAEDSIINWQKDYEVSPNDVPNYVHRDVLRTSMNGTYGVSMTSSAAGDSASFSYSKTIDPSWNDTHMTVIAFISDVATKEIIQVEQVKMQ